TPVSHFLAQVNAELPGEAAKIDLTWMDVPTERLQKIKPSERGLLLSQIEIGSYGYVPDTWRRLDDMPRGAWPPDHGGPVGRYSVVEKVDVWAENVRELYEEAILHRWAPATDVPWHQLEELPWHIELALDQVCTRLSEDALIANQVLNGWFERIAYGFHDAKLYLASVSFETARHTEAFRKRALANGGGLGVQGPAWFHRRVAGSGNFTEFVIHELVQRTSFKRTMCAALEERAQTGTDRTLFARVGADLDRQLAYSLGHLEYYVQYNQPARQDARPQVDFWLWNGERFMARDITDDGPMDEALMLVLGDGETVESGKRALLELRRRQIREYIERLASATIPRAPMPQAKRYDCIAPDLFAIAEPEAWQQMTAAAPPATGARVV
ncbi:MAG TPA: hypothetical protein VNL92_00920, partial [Dehalococcoidia bacterium]|nr:hypothetical protein [Dehalococcoidia bacterium]